MFGLVWCNCGIWSGEWHFAAAVYAQTPTLFNRIAACLLLFQTSVAIKKERNWHCYYSFLAQSYIELKYERINVEAGDGWMQEG
jgi:hypothetical protein